MPDIRDRDDILVLVRTFYETAFQDPMIGPIFTEVAHMDLEHHLPIMGDFWESVLFQSGGYRRDALALHSAVNAKQPLTAEHFDRWLQLWTETVDRRHEGPVADAAKTQAERIGLSMQRRLHGLSGSLLDTISIRPGAATA
ncbi:MULTISPECIES: group III truncated hemoglobin [unclassified Microbacterium]|uniref:group III truncated hemoglobin n=1 Tax=unclassified Microbacterium TaxID=2609290 RepID=UPI001E4D50D0|nr:group III truncated hemoglobin [Microbacterium sp. Au-Mic1]MCE4025386.1 group III truncated hemoglobin [Microbacterium sp. Au-Mic1]